MLSTTHRRNLRVDRQQKDASLSTVPGSNCLVQVAQRLLQLQSGEKKRNREKLRHPQAHSASHSLTLSHTHLRQLLLGAGFRSCWQRPHAQQVAQVF